MDTELRGIVGETPQVTSLATGFFLASGPVFSRRGYLLFCDAGASKILQSEGHSLLLFRDFSNGARGLTFDHQGRLLACEKDRLTRTEKNRAVTVLAATSRVPSLRGPLDVVFAIDGNIYFCDGVAVYRVRNDGAVQVATRDCEQPTSVGLAPNQQKLYVLDAAQPAVRVFDISGDGQLSSGRALATVKSSSPQIAGGLKTDESGRLWVAVPGGVEVFGRDGNPAGTVPLPASPTALNWAEGFRDLIVTTQYSVYRLTARTSGTRTY